MLCVCKVYIFILLVHTHTNILLCFLCLPLRLYFDVLYYADWVDHVHRRRRRRHRSPDPTKQPTSMLLMVKRQHWSFVYLFLSLSLSLRVISLSVWAACRIIQKWAIVGCCAIVAPCMWCMCECVYMCLLGFERARE